MGRGVEIGDLLLAISVGPKPFLRLSKHRGNRLFSRQLVAPVKATVEGRKDSTSLAQGPLAQNELCQFTSCQPLVSRCGRPDGGNDQDAIAKVK
jgi:hypothetical protein